MFKKFLAILISALIISCMFVSVSATGTADITDGTIDSPEDMLLLMTTKSAWSGSYTLTKDIDMSDVSGQTPIGNGTTNFTGIFDGAGYTVSGVNISTSAQYTGLFGYIKGATVKNLTIDGFITSTDYTGGIVGYANASTIENCQNKATVSGTGYVGGIVGYCYRVTSLTNCYNSGAVVSSASDVGGIVGLINGITDMSYCWSDGKVTFNNKYIGGMIGRTASTIKVTNCYADSTLELASDSSYTPGEDAIRAFCGYPASKNFTACYFGSATAEGTACTGIVAYTDDAFETLDGGSGKWVQGNGGPELAYFHEKDYNGDGYCDTCGEFLPEIKTAAALINLMTHETLWGGDYTLAADIDLTNELDQKPIGDSTNKFTGTFDGQGFEITLDMNVATTDVGLFGQLGEGAEVKNITVDGVVKSTGNYVGGIVGRVNTIAKVTIENCHNKADVTGNRYVGGIVGFFRGKDKAGTANAVLANCYNSGTVTATTTITNDWSDVGGIAGVIYDVGGVHDCAAGGEVVYNLPQQVGGLSGRTIGYSTVSNCYANARLTLNSGSSSTGGDAFSSTIGKDTAITACYFGDAAAAVGTSHAGVAAYTADAFDTLNTNGMWVKTTAGPELADFHTHTYDCYTDNGDGTHSPSCACGKIDADSISEAHTWNTDVTDYERVGLDTCTLCHATKAGTTFVYDKGAFATGYMQNKITKDITSYILRIIVRAYVPEDKTVEYYGIAMLPSDNNWTFEDGKNYVKKNEGSIESGATFKTDIESIPVENMTTDIFAWAFVMYEGDTNVTTVPIGTYNVQDYMYNVEG